MLNGSSTLPGQTPAVARRLSFSRLAIAAPLIIGLVEPGAMTPPSAFFLARLGGAGADVGHSVAVNATGGTADDSRTTEVHASVDLASFCNGNDSIDDTACIAAWIDAGRTSGAELKGSNGIYLYSAKTMLYPNMHLVCANNFRTRFRNIGGSALFLDAASDVQNVHIEGCDFDVNGNPTNFLTVIGINPPAGLPRSNNITIRRNRFRDTRIGNRMSAAQRQYVLLLNCDNCRVIENELSGGGRIKVGRPGSDILIHDNTLRDVNDNAITVVDINGGGLSERITITDNIVTNPRGVGIFFGADGEDQKDPALTTRNVVIEGNRITGDWEGNCIRGTLPVTASDIRIAQNTCVRTGVAGAFPAGISILRVNDATARAQNIVISNNEVRANVGWVVGAYPPLDLGGIFVKGLFDNLEVMNNRVRHVGPRAIHFNSSADVTNAAVVNNTLVGGTLVITGSVVGTITPNTVVP